MKKEKAVIDACNILHLESPRQRKPSIKNIFAVMEAVRASGREPIIVLDRAMLSALGEPQELSTLLLSSCVISIPAGSDATRVVLEIAQENDAIIVSNDAYVDYWNEYPWVELCRLPVAVIDGAVRLLEARFKNVGYLPTLVRTTS
jgi:hypothetical protein